MPCDLFANSSDHIYVISLIKVLLAEHSPDYFTSGGGIITDFSSFFRKQNLDYVDK